MRRLVVLVVGCVALISSGCLHLVTPEGPAPLRYRDAVFANVTKSSDITYDTALNQQGQSVTLKLDVYSPTGDTETSRPTIVWVHGGGFSSGNRNSPEIVDEANTFARKGYVSVSISYRLTPGGCSASGPTAECVRAIFDAQHDAQSAVRFLRANASTYGIDVNRIAIGGTSAGALTALHVGFNSDDPGDGGNQDQSSAVRAAVSLSGAKVIGSAGAGDAPSLLFHGTDDALVPYQWAQNTVNESNNAGVSSFLTTWEGEGHVPYAEHRAQILDQTRNFLYFMLDAGHAAQ